MNKTKVFWAAAAMAFAVTPAKAALIDVTWTGTVSSGDVGTAGAFGIQDQFSGNELAGQAFTATYRFDTTVGSLVTTATSADLRGGSQFGAGTFASPVVSATLTINGVTVSFGSDLFGGYSRQGGAGVSDIYAEVNASNLGGGVDILFMREFRLDNNIPFAGLTETLTQALGNIGDTVQGVFQQFGDVGNLLFSGNLASTQVTIAPFNGNQGGGGGDGGGGGGDVPEPASLALLALGLGLALERRRRRAG